MRNMLNYISAEVGRGLKRKLFWIAIMITFALAMVGCWAFTYLNSQGINEEMLTLEHYIEITAHCFGYVSVMLFIFVELITMEEFKNNTIKNIISSGLSRTKIYVGKNIAIVILAVIAFMILMISSLGMAYLILGISSTAKLGQYLQVLGLKSLGCAVLWIGALSLLHFMVMISKQPSLSIFIYLIAFMFLGSILGALGEYINPIFSVMNQLWLGTQIKAIADSQSVSTILGQGLLIGLGYTAIFNVIGVVCFKKIDL